MYSARTDWAREGNENKIDPVLQKISATKKKFRSSATDLIYEPRK